MSLPTTIHRALSRLLMLSAPVLLLSCVRHANTVETAVVPESRAGFERIGQEGSAVYVFEGGPLHAQRLLLIHGLGDQGMQDFWPIIPALTARYRVIALDLPGYGRSASPARAYSPDDYVSLLEGVLNRRSVQNVAVVGHSMGGALALLFASRHPERVSALALLDVAGILHFREYARDVVAQRLAERGDLLDPFRRFAHALFRLGVKPLQGTELEQLPIRPTPTTKFISYDFGHALHSVRAPVWIGWGRHDTIAPLRTMETLVYVLDPVGTAIYAQSAHVPMRSEPESVARDILAFLSSTQSKQTVAPTSAMASAEAPLHDHTCQNQENKTLRGDYRHISLVGCKNVKLHNVRARTLRVSGSTVELKHVELRDGAVGLELSRSRIAWVGGRIRSDVCIDTSGSRLNLTGVHCDYRSRGIIVRRRSHMVASVSALARDGRRHALHGEYTLQRD